MAATISPDPINKDRWFVSESEGQAPRLGAQFVHDPSDQLTVYWSGEVGRAQLFEILRYAVLEFGPPHPKLFPVIGKFIAYGENMREEIPIVNDGQSFSLAREFFAKKPSALQTFKAARAEIIYPSAGPLIIWANVTGHVRDELSRGGENIGVGLPPALFNGPARGIVVRAIEMTMKMRQDTISILLDKFSETLLRRTRPAAG
jgi:hypothetical protein